MAIETLFPLGLHFGLPFDRYLEDPGLGSGDVRLLAKNPSSWWWNSRHNPDRPRQTEKKHFLIGRAFHKLVLEGQDAFDCEYVRAPDHAQGLTSGQKAAATRKYNESMASSSLTVLKAEDYDAIFRWSDAIKHNPHLAACFQGGYAEVSVFWEREGVRLKGRFDYLKIVRRQGFILAANGDLKTVENIYLDDFRKACRHDITEYSYDAQAAHYLDGLSRVPQIVEDGQVYDLKAPFNLTFPVKSKWLNQFLADDLRCAWQWVFIQKNDMALTHSYTMTPGFDGQPGSPIFEEGASKVNVGIQNYIDRVERFGLDKPWNDSANLPPEELVPEEMPRWYGSAR